MHSTHIQIDCVGGLSRRANSQHCRDMMCRGLHPTHTDISRKCTFLSLTPENWRWKQAGNGQFGGLTV